MCETSRFSCVSQNNTLSGWVKVGHVHHRTCNWVRPGPLLRAPLSWCVPGLLAQVPRMNPVRWDPFTSGLALPYRIVSFLVAFKTFYSSGSMEGTFRRGTTPLLISFWSHMGFIFSKEKKEFVKLPSLKKLFFECRNIYFSPF